ncbi:MAG: hypothetical protein P4L38_08405 [Syntrophaceae bacterium]|nr:hypothetical protein [Syntrophaceae bacterium]
MMNRIDWTLIIIAGLNVVMTNTLRNAIHIVVLVGFVVTAWQSAAIADDFTQGIQALDRGQHELAVKFFSSYLARKPGTYEALVNRGTAFVRSGHVYHAISDWHRAGELAPLYAYAFYSDNVIRSVTANNKQIKYVASIELVPERAVSVVMTGAMFLDFGLKSSAIDLFRMSISLTSDPIFKTDLEYWIKTLDPAVKRNADWQR